MIERLETPRLIGERIEPRHFEPLLALYRDPLVAEWLGGPVDETERLAAKLVHWEEHGFGDWAFHDREGGALVGRAGLRRVTIGGADEVEVGYLVDPKRWNRGFATEMTLAALAAGFGEAGLDEIVAFTLPENVASRRVMEKAGLTYERGVEWAGRPHVLYRIRSGSSSDG